MRLQGGFTGVNVSAGVYILFFFWVMLIGAMVVVTTVQIIQRFITNFLKNQGSLMFTLPVTIWTLIASKVIAAFCMTLMGIITIFLSTIVITSPIPW